MKSCSYIQRKNYVAHSITNKFDTLSPITNKFEPLSPITNKFVTLSPITKLLVTFDFLSFKNLKC